MANQAKLLSVTYSHFTSSGEPDKIVEILIDPAAGQRQILVNTREFDDSGRVKRCGAARRALPNAEEIDPAEAPRSRETVYEPGTGRTLEVSRGGR